MAENAVTKKLEECIMDNIDAIEELVHQFCIKGGLKPGVYQCKSYCRLWEYKGEE